ncbi:CD302 antigen [Hypomesus transpacificus]|uniref:CD302 antigen n=1 Tax=Hypomesus transpacificus TaxID=137520 RepID=UPI001F08098F|nr:CD302 antigen [Hypomesus transpacificus]
MKLLRTHRRSSLYVVVFIAYLQSALGGDCPADGRTWVPFGQRCYHFVHGEEDTIKSYTREDAKSKCIGYELVTIQSAEENDFVISYSKKVWKETTNMWLGMYYDTDIEQMRWSDETAVSYTNWEDGDSSDLSPLDTCVALHTNTGKWENISCVDDVENGVVCQSVEMSAEEGKSKPSPLLSALVIVSVVVIMGASASIWFLHQKHHMGTAVFTSFEYHPPFGGPAPDEACLVETEEVEDMP